MRVRWRGLELPSHVKLDTSVSTAMYGRFTAEPFERGFGTTVGNSLRRILLSSLEGAAVTGVRIQGADHEFSSLKGVMEDVTDIILNIKGLIVGMEDDDIAQMRLHADTAGPVTAGQIELPNGLTIANPDYVIATLTEDVSFDMTLTVQKGRGYRTALENSKLGSSEEAETGIISVDSNFSPVVRVRYATEDARVGQKTDYDRLVLEVWTNGTVPPEMAVVEAAKILRKHLNPFVQYFELGPEMAEEGALSSLREAAKPAIDPSLEQKLNMTIQEMDLSVRANNCLESARIQTVRDLVQKTEGDLLRVRSFGKTSLREVKRRLADLGLSLGMDLNNLSAITAEAYVMDDDDDIDDDEDLTEDMEDTIDEQTPADDSSAEANA